VQRYADHIGLKNTGIGGEQEEGLLRMFKPIPDAPCLEVMPCTITDCHGRLLLWYLPNILRPDRQVIIRFKASEKSLKKMQTSMFADLHDLKSVLKVNYNQPTNWRAGPHFFRPVEGGLKHGTVNIAPAWFEQGHEVCPPTCI